MATGALSNGAAMSAHRSAVILLHGFAETSRMGNPILPALGSKFTVIVPDLPGTGDSSIPTSDATMKTPAIAIHALARSPGVTTARWWVTTFD
jgi:pimeloyl-ACP methyl ester carboxylesterase